MKTKLRALLIALLCVALAAGFSGCGMLESAVLPESVRSIGRGAFRNGF